eukprot:scaffold22390_cov24-Cyclotella_meneghiniana.AAC.2
MGRVSGIVSQKFGTFINHHSIQSALHGTEQAMLQIRDQDGLIDSEQIGLVVFTRSGRVKTRHIHDTRMFTQDKHITAYTRARPTWRPDKTIVRTAAWQDKSSCNTDTSSATSPIGCKVP